MPIVDLTELAPKAFARRFRTTWMDSRITDGLEDHRADR